MKKYLAVFLAALMMLSALVIPVGAEETDAADDVNLLDAQTYAELVKLGMDEVQYPTIMLPGINHSVYYVEDENGNPALNKDGGKIESGLLLLDTDNLVGTIFKDLLFPLMTSLTLQHDAGLSDAVYDLVGNIFHYMKVDENGDPVNKIGLYDYQTPVSLWDEETKAWFYRMMPMEPYTSIPYDSGLEGGNGTIEDLIYICTFPLLGNPMESAVKLKEMVDRLAAEYGKVNLCAVSLGGTLLTAYLDLIEEEDYSKLNSIIGFVAVLDGTSIIADFYERNWAITDEKMYNSFFPYLMEELGEDAMLGYLVNILIRIFPQKVLYNIISRAFEALLDTMIVNTPQFWAMMPADRYEAIADMYLTEGSVLKAKTDRFQQARLHVKDHLWTANQEYGVKVFTVSGYNMRFDQGEYAYFGLVKSVDTVNSDAIIDVRSTSLGATAGAPHQTIEAAGLLTENSVLTPDGLLDISTCLFPDTAFFFKGQHHEIGRNDNAVKLAALLMIGAIDDVYSTPLFPQVNGTRNTRTLVRSDNGWLVRAREILADENGTYTDEQKAMLQEAYDYTMGVIDQTICNQDDVDTATEKMRDAFIACGVESAPEEPSLFNKTIAKILKHMSDRLWATRGASGFFEAPDLVENVVDNVVNSVA